MSDTATKHAVAAALREAGRLALERAHSAEVREAANQGRRRKEVAEQAISVGVLVGVGIKVALDDAADALTKPAPKMTDRVL